VKTPHIQEAPVPPHIQSARNTLAPIGLTPERVAALLGVKYEPLEPTHDPSVRNYTDADRHRVISLHRQGTSNPRIAQILGIPKGSVFNIIKRHHDSKLPQPTRA
jgi:hypothetical protein